MATFGFGTIGFNYSLDFDQETKGTIVTIRIFDTQSKKDIIANLRKLIVHLNKYWHQYQTERKHDKWEVHV